MLVVFVPVASSGLEITQITAFLNVHVSKMQIDPMYMKYLTNVSYCRVCSNFCFSDCKGPLGEPRLVNRFVSLQQ